MNDAERRHKAKVAKHEVVEAPEFMISKEDQERLVELFSIAYPAICRSQNSLPNNKPLTTKKWPGKKPTGSGTKR